MRSKPPATLFGRRLRDARTRAGVPQDKLGVMVGIDEGAASARISRYETGNHAPPYGTALLLAKALNVPAAYFYCDDDDLAELLVAWIDLSSAEKRRWRALAEGKGSRPPQSSS